MIKIDYNFFYKNSLRFVLFSKLYYIKNNNNLPNISKISLFFSLKNIEDINDTQIYNYLYLFKFFFGYRAYISRIKSYFNLGKWTYSFKVFLIVNKDSLFDKLFLLINDFYSSTQKEYLKVGILSKKLNIFFIILKDMNIFSEKKTNLGLFLLKENLNCNIFCQGIDISSCKFLLYNLKLKLF